MPSCILCYRSRSIWSIPDVREDPSQAAKTSQRHPGAEIRWEEQESPRTLPLPAKQARRLLCSHFTGQTCDCVDMCKTLHLLIYPPLYLFQLLKSVFFQTAPASFMILPTLKSSLSHFHPQLNQLWRTESSSHFQSSAKSYLCFRYPNDRWCKGIPIGIAWKIGVQIMPHHRNFASILSLLCLFLLQKEPWGVWWFRETTFFCALLKSVPEVLWEAQVSVGALCHLLHWCHLLLQPLQNADPGNPAIQAFILPWDPCTCVAFRLEPWAGWEDCFLCVLYRIVSSTGISQVLLPVGNGWMA